jgi:uncharacterized protein
VALIIDVKVVTQSGKHALVLDKSGILKCFVKAAPEDGKANREVVELIATACNVPKKSVEIIQGLTSRKKRLAVETNITYEQLLSKLGFGLQKSMF